MTQGLFAAASGIRVNQAAIDVISNNIANVNTLAFKGSRTNFANAFTRIISGGSAPNSSQGGSNPVQMGTGAVLQQIAVNHNQGGSQFTGRTTDVMINGQGYFVVENEDLATGQKGFALSRAGNFSLDGSGNLVTATGQRVRGTAMKSGSTANTEFPVTIPLKFQIAKYYDAGGNVLGTAFGGEASASADFAAHATARSLTPASTVIANVTLTNFSIGTNGAITATYSNGDRISVRPNPDPTVNAMEIVHRPGEGGTFTAVNFTAEDGQVTQLGGANAVFQANGAGNPMHGAQLQIQSALVANPNGLITGQNNLLTLGANSGDVVYGIPASGSHGELQSGSLESSNVDLAQEFTNLVIAQRGLEAASRIIRTQSEVMQSVINAI